MPEAPTGDPASGRGVVEQVVVAAFPFLAVGLVAALPLMAVPATVSLLGIFTAQLSALVALGLAVTLRIARFADEPWFVGFGWTGTGRRLGAAAVLVVVSTGVVALVTLATSAALRLDPSLQFLQLLSALDIAWAAAALYVGVRYLADGRRALAAAIVLGVGCVASVWNYLRVVGFGSSGEWIVDGGELMRLVLPFDMVAAAIAIATVVAGARRVPER
jgi:hypothetical protein